MPRRPPLNPCGYYHVSTRGSFGQPLFQTADEHELYLELYARSATKFGLSTLAWALIWNHHHFLVKLSDGELWEAMRRTNHSFARRMNAVYGRTNQGHLVQHSCFARELVSDEDVMTVCRYIDLNPVAAHLCTTPAEWAWSGFAATMGFVKPRPFHDVRAELRLFGETPRRASENYARFVLDPSLGRVTEVSRAVA